MDTRLLINIILIVAIIIILAILSGYNRLVSKKNNVKRATSQIDVILNKRFDLIPNLVNCVKGYIEHESSTLEDVVKARNVYNQSGSHNLNDAMSINSKLNNLIAIAESYPDLKANEEFRDLQRRLSDIEDELADYRKYYNNAVTSYNNSVETIPTNIIAGMFNFKKTELFKLENDKKENIKIEL